MFGFGSASASANTSGTFASTPSGLFATNPSPSPGLFGSMSSASQGTGLFGQTGPSGMFSSMSAGAPSASALGATTPTAGTGLWASTPATSVIGGIQGPQGTNMGTLTTKEGKPISYNTKWEELSLQTQEYLLKIEQSVMDTRAACRNLESNNRIMDHSLLQKHDQEQEATVILQGLRSLAGMLHSDKNALKNFQSEVVSLLRDTEFAVRSYQRTTARRQADAAIASGASIPASMLESLGEPPVLPISYLKETLQGFEKALSNYQSRIDELEKILLPAAGISSQGYKEREVGVDFGVPGILNNLHEYFVHVAALVAKVHERASSLRTEFLTYQRKMGMLKNPFEEAEKKEVRQREAVLSSNGTVQAGGALVSPAPSQYTHVTGQVQHTPPPTSMLSSTGLAGGGMQGGMPQFGSPGTGFGSSGFGSQFQTPATSGGDGNRGRRSGRRR